MRYHILDKKHPFCRSSAPPEDATYSMKQFWKKHDLQSCSGAILATDKGKMVGFFRFEFDRPDKYLYATGTYVLSAYRRQGLGKKMWQRALRHIKPASVEVFISSPQGARLVTSLVRKGIQWTLNPQKLKLYKLLRPLSKRSYVEVYRFF